MYFLKVKDKDEVVDFEDATVMNSINSAHIRFPENGFDCVCKTIDEAISSYQRFLHIRYNQRFNTTEIENTDFYLMDFEIWDYFRHEKVQDLDRKYHNLSAMTSAFYEIYSDTHRFAVSSYLKGTLDMNHTLIHSEKQYLEMVEILKPLYQSSKVEDWSIFQLNDSELAFSDSVLTDDQLMIIKMSLPDDLNLVADDKRECRNQIKSFEDDLGVKFSDFT